MTQKTKSTRWDELAKLPFPGGYPSKEAAETLKDELAFQRAVQTYLWALPAMNIYGMREGQRTTFGDDSNILIIMKDRIDFNTLYSTGNPDVIYGFAWLDLKKEGPMVLDMPPNQQTLLDDMWHRPITDIGAAGPDKGKGGKHRRRELPEPCFSAILAALRARGKALAEMGPDEPLFDVSPHGFYLNLRRYLRKAGLPESGVHVLRHSAAKLRRDVGESVESVSRFLDHSNLAVTTTYLRRLEGEEDTGWRKVAALLD